MNKRTSFFLLAAAAVIALAVVSGLHHSSSTLLRHAQKIAPLGSWDATQDTYFWTSSRQALVLTQPQRQAPVRVQTISADTHQAVTTGPLEQALQKAEANAGLPRWQLSPDRRWLLTESDGRTGGPVWAALTLDGLHQITRPRSQYSVEQTAFPNHSLAAWSPDSRSWIQLQTNQSSGRDDALVSIYRLASPLVTTNTEGFMPAGRILLGFHRPARALAIYPRTGDGGGIGYVDFGASPTDPLCKIYYEHIPPNLDVQEVCLSPDGTQLAWILAVKPLPFGLQSTINSNYVRNSAPTAVGVWVSDLDCGNLRELGRADIREGQITALRWLPAGQALSFVYSDALYTVTTNSR